LLLEPIIAAQAKERQKTSTGGSEPQLIQKSGEAEPIRTDKDIAKVAGVSHDTIHKAKVIQEKADEETKKQLRKGETSNVVSDIPLKCVSCVSECSTTGESRINSSNMCPGMPSTA